MTPLPVSVIIVSRGRPELLQRCLTSIGQLSYPNFEVVVVADPQGVSAARDFPVKALTYDKPNISAARNVGIAAAAGEILAFLDDDAVPEPHWLWHLASVFGDARVSSAGGFVLGKNGLSYQWRCGTVDRLLRVGTLEASESQVSLHRARPGVAIEVKGVNCAYRRKVLAQLGGFDPELRYYLDETELNLRLAAIGATTAVVPSARVFHTKAASDYRRSDNVPRSLVQIGASSAITLRRHGASSDEIATRRAELRAEQAERLGQMLASGRITAGEVSSLLESFDAGFDEGLNRGISPLPVLAAPQAVFQRWQTAPFVSVDLCGRPWQLRRLSRQARALVAQGARVRIVILSPSTWFHRISFEPSGFWIQRGGLFGKSLRNDPTFRFWSFRHRFEREIARWNSTWKVS